MIGNGKEKLEEYEIESSVWIGGKRIVFGINEENKEKPRYMSCIVTDNGLFGRYEGIVTDDFFEAMKSYGDNIRAESIILENEQKLDGLKDTACLAAKDLVPIDWKDSIKECVVAIKPEVLSEGCRNIGNQIYYVVSGFGAEGNSRGSACYAWNLLRRSFERIERSEVMGIVPESLLPFAARLTRDEILHGVLKHPTEKPGITKKEGERS